MSVQAYAPLDPEDDSSGRPEVTLECVCLTMHVLGPPSFRKRARKCILNRVSAEFNPGELACIMGPGPSAVKDARHQSRRSFSAVSP